MFPGNALVQGTGGNKYQLNTLVKKRDLQRKYRVLTYNCEKNEKEFKSIDNFTSSENDKSLLTILIKSDNKTLKVICTADQKFWVKEKKIYIPAKELLENYTVYLFDTEISSTVREGKIFKVVKTPKRESILYGIAVEENHNYFINGVLTHD